MSSTSAFRGGVSRHHLDHAATSPLRPEARAAMIDALGAGNPNAQYAEGRAARLTLHGDGRAEIELLNDIKEESTC